MGKSAESTMNLGHNWENIGDLGGLVLADNHVKDLIALFRAYKARLNKSKFLKREMEDIS